MSTKKDKFSNKDHLYMNLALNLASVRNGQTGDNPSVGCVIVKNDKILSLGQTGYNGRPHAEFNAIKYSNLDLTGSKMYITLEPCNHYGQTPPCTNIIVKNNISEVIYGLDDIDKRVKGKSKSILRAKNIVVKKGLLKKEISNFYESYKYNRKKKLPYVTGKIAISKNNLIYSENKKKITDKYSDQITHFLRYKNDSILISYKTLNKDNPKLSCRLKGFEKFSPKRIIIDKYLDTNNKSYIFKSVKKNNTIIFYNKASNKKINLFKKKGIKLIKMKINKNNFNLKLLLKKLYLLGCRNLLVEGGNQLSKNFLNKNLFNQFYLFKSPNKLSKMVSFKEFNNFKYLTKNYKKKEQILKNIGRDLVYLYKN